MSLCNLCQKDLNDSLIYLTNDSFVHKNCEKDLYEEILLLEKEYAKLRLNIFAVIGNFFSKKINKIEEKLKNLRLKQKSMYDYWLTYPPDWNKRKEILKFERKVCNRCGKSKSRKHKKDFLEVHHIIPLNKGGNHLNSNLELLCKNCHKEEHAKNHYKFRKKRPNQSMHI